MKLTTTNSTMHAKTDSDMTSIEASTPPRSPRRPLYYVQSPSHSHHHHHQDPTLDKMSFGSSPFGSPTTHHHHFQYYHCSPIHHSRESSTSRIFSSGGGGASLKNTRMMQRKLYNEVGDVEEEDEMDGGDERGGDGMMRYYVVVWFLLAFVVLFGSFALILWGASLAYQPKVVVKSILFENFNVQAGMDSTGVPTDMLTLNSTVRIFYRNPATFFGVHVTATPLELHYFALKVASGHMKKFYQSRKSDRNIVVVIGGHQVPLYGGIPVISFAKGSNNLNVPLNLTFVMRSRAYILGRLVKTKFRQSISCELTFRGGKHLGKPLNFTKSQSCVYR